MLLLLPLLLILGASTQILAAPTNEINKEDSFTETLFQQMNTNTTVFNGFANTTITYKIENVDHKSKDCAFSVVVPKNGVITEFTMEVHGRKMSAKAEELKDAKIKFDQKTSSGLTGGHVAASASRPNLYEVTLHIASHTEVVFYLTYKTAIQRLKNRRVGLFFDIRPGQYLKNYTVEVNINEGRKIADVVPFSVNALELNFKPDSAPIVRENEMGATVEFGPVTEKQKRLGHLKVKGFSKQFYVQYQLVEDPLNEEDTAELVGDANGSQLLLNEMILTPGNSLVVYDLHTEAFRLRCFSGCYFHSQYSYSNRCNFIRFG